jgi:Glyoxalase-like domain
VATGRVQVTFDSADPVGLATFWAGVLGYPPPDVVGLQERPGSSGTPEADVGNCCRIADPTGQRPRLFFQRVPERKVTKNRVHLDVGVTSGGHASQEDVDREVARIVALGATILRPVRDDGGYFVVMRDPEGNEFCID